MHTFFQDVHNLNEDICNYYATLYQQNSLDWKILKLS